MTLGGRDAYFVNNIDIIAISYDYLPTFSDDVGLLEWHIWGRDVIVR